MLTARPAFLLTKAERAGGVLGALPAVMFFNLSKRHSRRTLLVEFNPYQILVAEISRPSREAVVLESAVEFDRQDAEGFRTWVENNLHGRTWPNVVCGLVPRRGIVHRESVVPRRLGEPEYLADVVQEQQKGRFLSSTPFKVLSSTSWTLRAVGAIDGAPLPAEGPARPALICGMANDELQEVQQRLIDERLMPDRIEAGLLSFFGSVYGMMEKRGDTRAIGIVVIHETATSVYILGKEGVHTPNPVLHGFASIMELTRKELGGNDDDEVRDRLENPDAALLNHAAKLVRRIGRDLKPVIDSFEMTTGQPVDEILCAYLPPKLGWIAEPLARATGRTAVVVDCAEWLPTVGLQVADGGPAFGPHWLGALSLVANLPDATAKDAGEAVHRPWHVDCRLAIGPAESRLPGRRFMIGALAVALAGLGSAITAWQLYATHSLRTAATNWERQIADHRKLFDDLTKASATLKKHTALFESAYGLMHVRYQLSDFFLSLGRTVPPHMRIDQIEANDLRVAVRGKLFEPAEEASATLYNYIAELGKNPAIGPLFSNIRVSALQRGKIDGDAVDFEITLRH